MFLTNAMPSSVLGSDECYAKKRNWLTNYIFGLVQHRCYQPVADGVALIIQDQSYLHNAPNAQSMHSFLLFLLCADKQNESFLTQ